MKKRRLYLRRISFLLLAAACWCGVTAHAVPPVVPGTVDPAFDPGTGPDGVVRAIAKQADGKILIGGWFNSVGDLPRIGLARLNSNGSLDTNFPAGSGPNAGVLAMAVQDDGRIVIAGDFSSVNGIDRQRVARLNPDGSLDTGFDPGLGTDLSVWAVAVQTNGQILIGGDFSAVGGLVRFSLARLNANGSMDGAYVPAVPNMLVRSLVLQGDGRLLVGGGLTETTGGFGGRVVRLESDGTHDASFLPVITANGMVNAVAVQNDGRIMIGGFFTAVAGAPRNFVARLMSNGNLDPGFNLGVGPDNGVSAIAVQPDGKIVIGGGFVSVNGRPRGQLARLNQDGRLDSVFEFDPGADSWIEAVTLQNDGHILIGGAFTQVGGLPRSHVARVLGGDPPPFAPVILTSPTNHTLLEGISLTLNARARGFPEPTYQWRLNGVNLNGATEDALGLRNLRLTNAGTYTIVASNSLGSVTGVVAVLTVIPAPSHPGSLDIDFYAGTGPDDPLVNSIAVQPDGKILIGGGFALVDGVPRHYIARLARNGTLDGSFVSTLAQQGFVQSLAVQGDGRIVVGGYYFYSLARLLDNGLVDTSYPLVSNPPELVETLELQSDGKLLVGGTSFTSALGRTLKIQRFDPTGAMDASFVVQSNSLGSADDFAVQPDGRVLVGGDFTFINGVSRGRIARLNTDGSVDPAFDPGSGANERVSAVARQSDGKILIAGQFTRVNGILRNRVARLNANGTLDLSFNPGPGPNRHVGAMALAANGQILIGGEFTEVDGIPRGHVARLNPDGSLDAAFDSSAGADGSVRTIVVEADGGVLVGGTFYWFNGVPRPGIARLRGGGPVSQAPVIVVPPTNQLVAAGADVTLAVLATGTPMPSYQWQFNGVNIPGANAWVLTLPNVRATNGGIYRVVVTNPNGVATSTDAVLSVVPASLSAGSPDISFYTGTGPNDRVNAIVPLADGRIIIGGAFTAFDGRPRGHLARLQHSGVLDATFGAGLGADGSVNALALQTDGKLIVGGAFTSINGVPRNRVARLNGDGSLDASFDPGLGADGAVSAVAVAQDGRIMIGGAFSFVGGAHHPAIARLETSGVVDATFGAPFATGSSVLALGFQRNGRVLAGGLLSATNGFFLGLAGLTAQGGLDPLYANNFGPNAAALALAVQEDDRVLIGGQFSSVAGIFRLRVAQLETNGLTVPSFDSRLVASNTVRAVAVQRDGRVLIGGDFTGVSGRAINRIARLTTNGLVDASFDPGSGVTDGASYTDEYGEFIELATVNAIAVEADGRILIGGDFTKVNGVTRPGLARLYDHELVSTIQIRPLPGARVELYWEVGVLQQAPALSGPWVDVPVAPGAYEFPLQPVGRFFRLRLN